MLVASLTFVDALLRISSATKLFVVHLLFLDLWDQRQLTNLSKFSFLRLLKHVSSFAATMARPQVDTRCSNDQFCS
uniref:Uncharacterized protein n=1 Tax=Triticum urartu TaxID=4572 RepID=A0A8R7JX94_TRIUA